jgi:hypothetical protein
VNGKLHSDGKLVRIPLRGPKASRRRRDSWLCCVDDRGTHHSSSQNPVVEKIPPILISSPPAGALASGIVAQIAATIPEIRSAKVERRALFNNSIISIVSLSFWGTIC